MEKVTGIGGIFFRAKDPEKLAQWYEDHLGVMRYAEYGELGWRPKGGTTVFYPFNDKSTEFTGDAPDNPIMLNFRVSNLEAMAAQLRKSGVEVSVETEPQPNGHFAQLVDPEGNPIELWEPSGIDKETEEK